MDQQNTIANVEKSDKIETVIKMAELKAWETMTTEGKRRALYDRQAAALKTFLEHGAITRQQHEKSLGDLSEKMGFSE